MLSTADAAITTSVLVSGSLKPKPKWTTNTVTAWPRTAIQRIRTSRRRLTETSVGGGVCVVSFAILMDISGPVRSRASVAMTAYLAAQRGPHRFAGYGNFQFV